MRWSLGVGVCAAICALGLAAMPRMVSAHERGDCADEEGTDSGEVRAAASKKVEWEDPNRNRNRMPIQVQLLGINDFHGQLSEGRRVAGRPVGGAAVLAAYLESEQGGFAGDTLIVHAGDHVGASPAASALLQDEPSITFLNMLGNSFCRPGDDNPHCNLVGTLGNHEFDEGVDEMLRLIGGGNHANGPYLDPDYRGAAFPYVSANVVWTDSGEPVLPPYVIRKVGRSGKPGKNGAKAQGPGEAKIAFIGAVLKETPTIVTPTGVAGVSFLDEADAINRYIPDLREQGVEAIVVLIHQGGRQTSYTGPTRDGGAIDGPAVNDIVTRLDSAVDVVVSGHAHAFSNALIENRAGHPILVAQAFSASTAFDDIELSIDPVTGDVVAKSGSIVTTWADVGPGLMPDPDVAALVALAEDTVAPLVNQVIGETESALSRTQNLAGESALGNLIADAQRSAMGTDFAFMNPGGIRADLDQGPVTWGELFTVQPFGNSLVRMNLTGAQVYAVLEQQWAGQPFPRIMQIAGLRYTWNAALPVGSRVVEVRQNGVPIDPAATYTITCNNFMAAGGDNFTVFTQGTGNVGGPVDLDALIDYIQALPQPFSAVIDGRIQRLN